MNKKNQYTRREVLSRLALVPAVLSVPQSVLWANNSSANNRGGYVSLFDGRTLAGWHTNKERISHGDGGRWWIERRVLLCEQDPPGSGNGGMLLTDKKYGDFELEIDMMPDWDIDSGIFLRTNEKGHCFQIYVDHKDNGLIGFISTEGPNRMYIRPFTIHGVFNNKGRLTGFETKPDSRDVAWKPDYLLYHASPEQWKKAWKTGKWNTLRVRCVGRYPKITTWINNVKIMEFCGETCPSPLYRKDFVAEMLGTEGHIGIQIHGGKTAWREGSLGRWKNIRIKEL